MKRVLRVFGASIGVVLLLLLPLAIPPADPVVPPPPEARPFVWARDSVWRALERTFAEARVAGCADSATVAGGVAALERDLARLRAGALAPSDPVFDALEHGFFALGPRVAACPALIAPYVATYARMRDAVKRQSAAWDVNATAARDRLYRALYGGRAAVEEVMLQHADRTSPLLRGAEQPSATPSAVSNGVTLHSGDVLVSRGGYPTSALIARGNDYPGNFSHIALVHVDSATRAITVVEAHIELGVALATAEQYLADKKLRVMLLRPRADLPALVADPMLPHKAATAMLERARREHIPYDFAMDYADPSRLFCSEVASQAYRTQGLELWMGVSTITRPGLRRWLAGFGVRNFATQEPSDLEYDPQLAVVAEWHDGATLFDDHIDNAVTDVMLEGAERGAALTYPWYQLPFARVLKGWSWVRARTGGIGPIPEGMAPDAALRNRAYGARHDALAAQVKLAAEQWRATNGYVPPYWMLVELARTAAASP
jgi:Permuted papain-like amidase enzyme, YaeF/YiiX, C92 family